MKNIYKTLVVALLLAPSLAFAGGGGHDRGHDERRFHEKHEGHDEPMHHRSAQKEQNVSCPEDRMTPAAPAAPTTTAVYVPPPAVVYAPIPAPEAPKAPVVRYVPPKAAPQATTTLYIRLSDVPYTGYEGDWLEQAVYRVLRFLRVV